MQAAIHSPCADRPVSCRQTPRAAHGLLSLTYPSKELFHRQRASLRGAALACFTSPANDFAGRRTSLDEHSIQHAGSTFFMRVAGNSMRGLGIFDGDLLVVDRALPAAHGCVVIAVLEGEFTVKQLLHAPEGRVLRAAHPDHADTLIKPEHDFSVWGVVRWNIHKA